MNGSTVPCHQVVLKHAAAARRRLELLQDLVGLDVVFLGEHGEDGTLARGALYRERVGTCCRIVGCNEHVTHVPLVVEWPGGEKGLAEPEWLMEVARG